MRGTLSMLILFSLICMQTFAQPIAFVCSDSEGFGYYSSSATETINNGVLIYSSSRLSKITTSTGARTEICSASQLGVALNALAFNPQDNFLYAVSRYDATHFSGKLYRIGENCVKQEITISGIQKFTSNNTTTVDNGGGNIGSGTFDLDNNYYVNTSFTNTSYTGFTNKLQKIKITGNTATVTTTSTLTCASCTGKVQINDIIFDEASGKLVGSNFINKQLYRIEPNAGVMTPIGPTGITNAVLGMYKNKTGAIRAITDSGNIYNVNVATGAFTLLSTATDIQSKNADGASGCYRPPLISGNLFLDNNRLTDGKVNGTGTNIAGTTVLYANLVQNNVVIKSTPINANGTYQFLGIFSGTYEVQISSTLGIVNNAPPAQNLPSSHTFIGENIGVGIGNDGTPNGKIAVTVSSGNDVTQVNFGIDIQAVVPVDFLSFQASVKNSQVHLIWETANEINNNYFEVQRQQESGSYIPIGRVAANSSFAYSFVDRDPKGIVYYRIKQVDFNGTFMYSKIIGLNLRAESTIKVYPTILQDELNIESHLEAKKIEIYTFDGRKIFSQSLESGHNIFSVANFANGRFVYLIYDKNNNMIQNGSIIKI